MVRIPAGRSGAGGPFHLAIAGSGLDERRRNVHREMGVRQERRLEGGGWLRTIYDEKTRRQAPARTTSRASSESRYEYVTGQVIGPDERSEPVQTSSLFQYRSELHIHLRTEQDRNARHIEPEQQHNHSAQRAIRLVVGVEKLQVQPEQQRRAQPQ